MEKLNDILFYNIDKSIRTYRVFAQKELRKQGFKMTIDQWLIIKCIMENPNISQQELGERVFKDNASVTRIIELLVKNKYLSRKPHKTDRRRTMLIVSNEAKTIIADMHEVVLRNRAVALKNISNEDVKLVNKVLLGIITNCNDFEE
ncbi:MAG: MarR family transcriptional regulator [Bacteroidota bacterium]